MKMIKLLFLSILLIVSFSRNTYSQTKTFFDDVAAMKLSMCFKEYTVADRNMIPDRLPGGMSSQKVFLNTDSSMMVAVQLSNVPRSSSGYQDDIRSTLSFKKGNQNTFPEDKLVKKFGAQSGFATGVIEQPSPSFQGYIMMWGGMLFSKSGMFSIQVYRKTNFPKKMSEKALINFASDLIRFNN